MHWLFESNDLPYMQRRAISSVDWLLVSLKHNRHPGPSPARRMSFLQLSPSHGLALRFFEFLRVFTNLRHNGAVRYFHVDTRFGCMDMVYFLKTRIVSLGPSGARGREQMIGVCSRLTAIAPVRVADEITRYISRTPVPCSVTPDEASHGAERSRKSEHACMHAGCSHESAQPSGRL